MNRAEDTLPVDPVSLTPGQELPEAITPPFTRTDFVRYAGAGGDFNPLHHDEEYAKGAGMPSVFGMGMLHAGMLGVRLSHWVGPENIRTYKVRFTGQVWPGDILHFTGVVDSIAPATEAHEGPLATISLEAVTEGGDPVLQGQATFRVAP